jgi:hypothetical protein
MPFLGPFDHHPAEHLGAAVAQHDAAVVPQALFDAALRLHDFRQRAEVRLGRDAHVDEQLREDLEARAQLRERRAALLHRAQQLEAGVETIARVVMLGAEDDVTRGLAAERQAVLLHRRDDGAIADRRLDDVQALAAQALLEAEVAHHGHGDLALGELALGVHRLGEEAHQRIAMHDLAALVDEDRAVAVTVEAEADVAVLALDLFGDVLRMQRAALLIDVAAIGAIVADHEARAEVAEDAGGQAGAGAVRAVDQHAQAAQAEPGEGSFLQPTAILEARVFEAPSHPGVAGGQRLIARHGGFDLGLDRIGQLAAIAAEELDAVVRSRVVRRRDHDAGVVLAEPRLVGQGRCRQEAAVAGMHARAEEPGFERAPDLARAAAAVMREEHDLLLALALGGSALNQLPAEHRAQPQQGHRIERRVIGFAANAIGPEQAHGLSASGCCVVGSVLRRATFGSGTAALSHRSRSACRARSARRRDRRREGRPRC